MSRTILRPFIPAMVNHIEEWLSQMSNKGLVLIYMNGWKFVFAEEKKSMGNEYFIYSGFDASVGFSYDFYRAKEKYASNSTVNKSNCCVFEVDPLKKDDELEKYRFSRNNYYKKHYIMLLLTTFCFGLISFILSIQDDFFVFISCLLLVATFYSTFSLFIILKKMGKKTKSPKKKKKTRDGSMS